MLFEKNYDFRKELLLVHQPNRRNNSLITTLQECEITEAWVVSLSADADDFIKGVADDLTDYFSVSMEMKLAVCQSELTGPCMIRLSCDPAVSNVPRSFLLKCQKDYIEIIGRDPRGLAQGCYYLEDVMNLREAPFIPLTEYLKKEPLFSPRMIHSGYGIDQFPLNYLIRAAHHGYDSILIFVRDADCCGTGPFDFAKAIDDAEKVGLDVYFYSYMISRMHPDDEGAEAYYDSTYGELFRRFPKAKGVILVGESCKFPSHDQRTTMTIINPARYGIPPAKPSPASWPCTDYPDFLRLLSKVMRKHKPDVDIVFWTYNWGSTPKEDRLRLIENIPAEITLLATFEMYDNIKVGGTQERVLDYSISNAGPGAYFISEAEAAKKRGLKLYTISNTGGRTWDIGVVPYMPAPQQWGRRYDGLHRCRSEWGLSGLMESHHFGWYPSVVSELAKWSFWSGSPGPDTVLHQLAVREFSRETADQVVEAWNEWSIATQNFVTPIEDQYGPCRVGPSYPFIFSPDILRTMYGKFMKFPSYDDAFMGGAIVFPWYRPVEDANGLEPGILRIKKEIAFLPELIAYWQHGIDLLERARPLIEERKKLNAEKMIALGKFCRNVIRTTLHIKQWWLLNQKLLLEEDEAAMNSLLERMTALLQEEIANVKDTMRIVQIDSHLGFEPAMDYMTDQWHLEWKLKQVDCVLNYDIPAYRNAWKNKIP